MDLLLRVLRDGTTEGAERTPLALVGLSDEVAGAFDVLAAVIGRLAAAIAQGRAQASKAVLVSLDDPDSLVVSGTAPGDGAALVAAGLAQDPAGWLAAGPPPVRYHENDAEVIPCVVAGVEDDCMRGLGVKPQDAGAGSTAGAAAETDGAQVAESLEKVQLGGNGQAGSGGAAERPEEAPQEPPHDLTKEEDLLAALEKVIAGAFAPPQDVPSTRADAGAAPDPPDGSVVVVIHSLSWLHLFHSIPALARTLAAVREHPAVSAVLCSYSPPCFSPQELVGLKSLAEAILTIGPASDLDVDLLRCQRGCEVHGRLETLLKLRTGRGKVSVQMYAIDADATANGRVQLYDPPVAGPATAQILADSKLQAAASGHGLQTPPMSAVSEGSGVRAAPRTTPVRAKPVSVSSLGMRLELSSEERKARDAVVLPWQHTGDLPSHANFDAEEYLPPAAGGRGPGGKHADDAGGQKLGHIMYVRDSDSDYDSDEDPDDDLDI
ncbi:unnamed protein product [Pedinophyceae sp. YPF-701]|nr:unnamed protein product [Pedinophyceae sp. YPF-701]